MTISLNKKSSKIKKHTSKISNLTVGVLALQGAVREHAAAVRSCGAQVYEVRKPEDINDLDGLIIPGGESTTIGKLMVEYDLVRPVKNFAAKGMPIFGTCAGLIILAKRITEGSQPLLELMNIEAKRNAFGRQTDSFEAEISVPVLGSELFKAVFIRAPWIESVGPGVSILGYYDTDGHNCGKIVLAEEGNILVSAFHPELTDDRRLHEYFLEKALKSRESRVES